MELASWLKQTVLGLWLALGFSIVGVSWWAWSLSATDFNARKDAIQILITQTLLPMFTTLSASALAYIFAHAALSATRVYVDAVKRSSISAGTMAHGRSEQEAREHRGDNGS